MKNIIRIVLAVSMFIVMTALLVSCGGNVGTPQAVLDARQSVVRVVAMEEVTDWPIGHGSGFVVAQRPGATYVATNRHVVVMNHGTNREYEAPEVRIVLNDLRGTLLDAQVVYITDTSDATMDLVLLRVPTGLTGRAPLPLVRAEDIVEGERIFALGFPGVADDVDDEGWSIPSTADNVTLTGGIIGRSSFQVFGRDHVQHDAAINPGNSGGPLLNWDGSVIGVNTWTALEGTGTSGAVNIGYVMDFLDEIGVPYVIPHSFIQQYGILIIILAAAVIIFALGMIFFVSLRSRAVKPVQPVSSGVQAPPVILTRLSGIRGSSGQYNTKAFPIPDKITLGRDPARCAIVFDPNAKGVSSFHCEVSRIGDNLLIIDRGSTYGTFVRGVKIAANTPIGLSTGDSFYLGDKANSFTVY